MSTRLKKIDYLLDNVVRLWQLTTFVAVSLKVNLKSQHVSVCVKRVCFLRIICNISTAEVQEADLQCRISATLILYFLFQQSQFIKKELHKHY